MAPRKPQKPINSPRIGELASKNTSGQASLLSLEEKALIDKFNKGLYADVVNHFAKSTTLEGRYEAELHAASFLGKNKGTLNHNAIDGLKDPYNGHISLNLTYSALANFRQGLSNAALEDLKQLGITTKDRADKIANILYDNKHQIKSKYMTSMLKSPNMKAVSEKFNLLMNQDAIKDFHKTFSKPYLAIKNEKEKALAEAERSNPELQNEINLANQELKKIESLNTVEGIAAYLHNHKPPLGQEEAYKTKIGEYLSEEHSIDVLDSFTKGVKFSNKGFIEDLREYVAQIKIPGEAQKIERVMDSFGKNYATNHPQIFQKDEQYSAEDKASILGTATILLNTDLHNPNVKKRITLDEFLKQNDYIGIPQEFRKNIYTDVQAQEFKFSNSAKTTPDIPSVQSKPRQLRENINKIGESLTKAGKALAKFMPTLSHKKGSANLSADLPTSTPSVIPKNKKTPKGYQEL